MQNRTQQNDHLKSLVSRFAVAVIWYIEPHYKYSINANAETPFQGFLFGVNNLLKSHSTHPLNSLGSFSGIAALTLID